MVYGWAIIYPFDYLIGQELGEFICQESLDHSDAITPTEMTWLLFCLCEEHKGLGDNNFCSLTFRSGGIPSVCEWCSVAGLRQMSSLIKRLQVFSPFSFSYYCCSLQKNGDGLLIRRVVMSHVWRQSYTFAVR